MSFVDFGFSPSLQNALKAAGFDSATPIQQQAIPEILSGKDLVGLAQTGTGKTGAFVLPLVERLLANPGRGLRVLVLVPTRELAVQVLQVFKTFTAGSRVSACAVFGGASMGQQIRELRGGANVVVACPGRLLDHMGRGTIRLNQLEALVLDEADQMFEKGFLPDIKEIIRSLPKQRQTLLFSATMPKEVRSLADEVLKEPVTISAGGESKPAETVEHSIVAIDQEKKMPLLVNLLGQDGVGSVLVFTRTKSRAESIGKQLVKSGFSTTTLQGNLSQSKRLASINGFRKGKYQVLVATDIASRGIDVPNITHVINYDIPENAEIYTHRIGRTGRASQRGEAITFIAREDVRSIAFIERSLGKSIERRTVEGFEANFPLTSNRPSRGRGPRNGRGPSGNKRFRPRTSSRRRTEMQTNA